MPVCVMSGCQSVVMSFSILVLSGSQYVCEIINFSPLCMHYFLFVPDSVGPSSGHAPLNAPTSSIRFRVRIMSRRMTYDRSSCLALILLFQPLGKGIRGVSKWVWGTPGNFLLRPLALGIGRTDEGHAPAKRKKGDTAAIAST